MAGEILRKQDGLRQVDPPFLMLSLITHDLRAQVVMVQTMDREVLHLQLPLPQAPSLPLFWCPRSLVLRRVLFEPSHLQLCKAISL